MTQDRLSHAREAFNAFRVESMWVRTVYDTFTALYGSGPDTTTMLRRTAHLFFSDLNAMFVEYWVLVVCRLTDPPETLKRENLTVKMLLVHLKRLGLLTEPMELEAKGLQRYRDLLNTARNRVVSHADKATFLSPSLLGVHDEADVAAFLGHLQRFNDLVGTSLGEGPLDFVGTSGPGDVYDLLRAIANAA